MSYNIVRKNKSTVLVHKFRDPNNPGKVVEKYLLSMGVQTDARHKEIRKQVNELAQEDRINFCQKSGLVIEVPEDVPRKKAPTGDIREQPVKKERKVGKKQIKKEKVHRWVPTPVSTIPHTIKMRERVTIKKEIKASKIKSIAIPKHITDKNMQKKFLQNLKGEYRQDIKEYRKDIRMEEIKMPSSLYAQRKEKIVIADRRASTKAAENIIKRIDYQIAKM